MLHRTKKKHDINRDKWIGVGGHFFENETPDECLIREVREETGLTLTSYRTRGVITFISETDDAPLFTEYMFLYTADGFTGDMIECDEGDLVWVDKDRVAELNLWEGDKIFLRLLETEDDFFTLKLRYVNDKLVESVVGLDEKV